MDLNDLIHQPVRLRVMSALSTLSEDREVEFSALRDALDVTDGNLGGHLRKLSSAGYIEIKKSFVNAKPRSSIRSTPAGRRAFLEHVQALEEVIRGPIEL